MSGLLSISCSNADSERGFSMLRKIHTDQRSHLDQSTIVALMSLKFNCDIRCFDVNFDDDLLAKCKKATYISLRKYNQLFLCMLFSGCCFYFFTDYYVFTYIQYYFINIFMFIIMWCE